MADMVPDLQATGIALAALSVALSGWVALRCRHLQTGDQDSAIPRATLLVAMVAVLFALGVGLVMIPRLFYVGELLVLIGGSLIPIVWAWLGHRIVSEAEETTLTSRRLFGLGSACVLIFVVYLLVSRPVFSEDVWFVEKGERWLFFVLLILGAWAMS